MSNLMLPGNPRYQPKDLVEDFGYDNLARPWVEVEIATMWSLGECGVISEQDIALLTPDIEAKLLSITMTEVDEVERNITRHDARALVRLIQEILPPPLRRYAHVPLTSYDVIDTARALQFVRTYKTVVRPKVRRVIECFWKNASRYANQVQVGRTHGQHALPITVGFWFATILSRVLFNAAEMDRYAKGIVGKISGAVGANNAQVAFGLNRESSDAFEVLVLNRLGLKPAPISTQIAPPEPIAYYLYSCLMLSAALGQFGRDGRNLMRSEIAELAEPFESDQIGSSTMPQKRNPVILENLEGMFLRTKKELGAQLDALISDHQRDLVGSSLARDLPIIVVNLTEQLDRLLRPGKKNPLPFLERLVIDTDACERNLRLHGDTVLAEPLYLALQLYGYEGDAHEVINRRALPLAKEAGSLLGAVMMLAENDSAVRSALDNFPAELVDMLRSPKNYTGNAAMKVHKTVERAQDYLAENS